MMALIHMYLSTAALLAPSMACVGAGVIWGKRNHPFAGAFVTVLVTSITVPALVFHNLVSTELDGEVLGQVALATVLALAAGAVLCAGVLRLLGLPVRKLLQISAMPNAGNLGLPMAQLVFGADGLSVAIVFFTVTSFLTHTLMVRTLPGADKGSWKSPILFACLVAVACRSLDIALPVWVLESTALLGSVTVPMMLLSLGHALGTMPASGLRQGSVVAVLRLVSGALAGLAVGWALQLPPKMAGMLALQMVMPCAVISYMYARRFTDAGDVAAGAVLISTLVFLALTPGLLWLAHRL